MKRKLAVIQALLILLFIACGAYAVKYFTDSKKASDSYDNLKQLVKREETEDITDGYIPKRIENGMLEEYYELYSQNNDMIGWIRIPDTKVDYPVVQYSDNEFYLHRNFEKKRQSAGIPFMDYQCADNSKNKIIYAHNMKDGSMFADITKYKDKAFYEAHKQILFDTLYDKGRYAVLAAFEVTVGSKNEFKYYEYTDMDSERFKAYMKELKENELYDTGISAEEGDELITLSTCAYRTSNERFVVVAKRIKY